MLQNMIFQCLLDQLFAEPKAEAFCSPLTNHVILKKIYFAKPRPVIKRLKLTLVSDLQVTPSKPSVCKSHSALRYVLHIIIDLPHKAICQFELCQGKDT